MNSVLLTRTARAIIAVTLLSMLAVRAARAQEQQQPAQSQQQTQPDGDLSADEIIQILQENPDVLAEAKTEIVAQLQNRGYSVTERDVTDQRLFDQIRGDDRVRHLMSDALKQRGFVTTEQGSGEQVTGEQRATTPAPSSSTRPATRSRPSPTPPPSGSAMGRERPEETQRPSTQEQYPLRNLPAIRDLYTQAVNPPVKLERFGASLFRNSVTTAETTRGRTASDVPVGPDYIVGAGDELIVEYWGRSTQRLQLTVDREGRVVIPEAGGIVVAGRTLGEAQQAIQKMLTRQFRDITVDVSMGRLRTVRIYVVGDVTNPGAYDISSLSTPLNAIIAAGGPTNTGSYRLVRHVRGKKPVEEVDLYELMLKGVSSASVHLESGDSILVPPVGPQVTVAGSVRRPAIYELRDEQTLDQVLDLAGGVPVTGELNNVKVERVEAHERKEMLNVNLPQTGGPSAAADAFKRVQIKDGDTVTVSPILPYSNQTVYLQGHVFRPGKYPFKPGLKVTDVIRSFADLLPEPADRGEIVRLHPPDLSPVVIAFNVRDVLENKAQAPELQPFDTVRVFGRYDADAPKVAIYGEVLRPGEYPLSERMTVVDLVRAAGGFKRSAFTETADLSSYSVVNGEQVEMDHRQIPIAKALSGTPDSDVLLKPGDVLTIGQIGGWNDIGGAIAVTGEVLHAGRYGIQRAERLSAILKRAGGFTAEAYPYGAILERAQVRELSARSRGELVANLQGQATLGAGRTLTGAIPKQNQDLINRLKEIPPNGRLVIHITTDISKWENTPFDVEVRPGDTLFIPKRPNFVMVAGQVYSPSAITFSGGKHASWYLHQAGGPTSIADKKDIFVVKANGSVVGRGSGQWWSGNVLSTTLQPGDTIFVPDKVSGGNPILKNAGLYIQLLSGAAVAASVIRTF